MSTVSSVTSATDISLVIHTRGLTKTYKEVNVLRSNNHGNGKQLVYAVVEYGWRRGFHNLLHNENDLRWSRRRWLAPALIWITILNGFVLLVAGKMLPAVWPIGGIAAVIWTILFTVVALWRFEREEF